MRLSEAIRLGAMLKPQGTGHLFGRETCAIGAALEAAGRIGDCALNNLPFEWGRHPAFKAACPQCGFDNWTITPDGSLDEWLTTPSHLNDRHCWTREQIADWVESVEAQMEPQQAPDTQPVAVTI